MFYPPERALKGSLVSILASLMLASCSESGSGSSSEIALSVFGDCGSGAVVELPCGFPMPLEQENNPLSKEKIELGRLLFYDRNMSFNATQSCADCHQSDKAFTDGLTVSEGSEGGIHPRNAMSMTNVVYNTHMNWANSEIVDLVAQSRAVLLNPEPIELGWTTDRRVGEMLDRLKSPDVADYASTLFDAAAPDYPALFADAFPDNTETITLETVNKALAAFGSTMISGDSEHDKEQRGEDNSMSEAAKAGRDLFLGERLECFHCHGGFNFNGPTADEGQVFTPSLLASFHNNGIGATTGNPGLAESTTNPDHLGFFRAPTLRNIDLTAPYMHDGSIATLDEVIDHYAAGGRDGVENTSDFINGFVITPEERSDLIEFFKSLTDWEFICRDSLSDPFGIVQKHAMCP